MPKLTSKGQVTIPKPIRDRLGLAPGAEVEFEPDEQGNILLKSKQKRELSRFAPLRGSGQFSLSSDELMRLTRGWGDPDREGK